MGVHRGSSSAELAVVTFSKEPMMIALLPRYSCSALRLPSLAAGLTLQGVVPASLGL